MTLVQAINKEIEFLKKSGYKPRFKGDTGVSIDAVVKKYNVDMTGNHAYELWIKGRD